MVLHEAPRLVVQSNTELAQLKLDWLELSQKLTKSNLELGFQQALELRQRAGKLVKPVCIL